MIHKGRIENELSNAVILGFSITVALLTWFLGLLHSSHGTSANTTFYIVVGLWLIWGMICIAYLIQRDLTRWLVRTGLVVVLVLVIGLTLEKGTINSLLAPFNVLLDSLAKFLGTFGHYVPSAGKVGHVIVFFGLSFNLLRILDGCHSSKLGIMGFIGVVAVATEGLQLFVPTRTTNLHDLGYDGIGMLAALFWSLKTPGTLELNQ